MDLKKEIKTVLKIAKKEFSLKFFTSIMIRGLLLLIPFLFSKIINYITEGEYKSGIIIVVLSIVVTAIYRFLEGYNQVAYYKLYKKIFSFYNSMALSKTNDNSLFSLSRFTPGGYTNMVITDVDIITSFYTAGVIRVVQVVEFLIIYLYFLSIDVKIFAGAVLVSIIMIYVSIKSGDKVEQLNKERKSKLDSLTTETYNFFLGIKDVKSFNVFNKIYPKYEESADEYLDGHAKYNVKFNVNNHSSLYVFEVARLLTILYAFLLVSKGHLLVGSLVLIYNYYQKIIDNFSTILTFNIELRNVNVSYQRYSKILEYSREKRKKSEYYKGDFKGEVIFKNILYGFRSNPTLDMASFDIKPNSINVLTGKDEAAQQGIFDLLLKLNRQHEGEILIDGLNINDIDDNLYFNIISSVRRHTTLFDVSLKDNFLMINPDFDKVVEVCQSIGLDDEIKYLENGYDTIINENTPISQSTKELIYIARMLLVESRILLFDDLINVLEIDKEKLVWELLNKMKKNHTIIIISHANDIIKKADHVYDVSDKYVSLIK